MMLLVMVAFVLGGGFLWLSSRRALARRASSQPPESTEGHDGRREGSGRGWVRELQGRWPGLFPTSAKDGAPIRDAKITLVSHDAEGVPTYQVKTLNTPSTYVVITAARPSTLQQARVRREPWRRSHQVGGGLEHPHRGGDRRRARNRGVCGPDIRCARYRQVLACGHRRPMLLVMVARSRCRAGARRSAAHAGSGRHHGRCWPGPRAAHQEASAGSVVPVGLRWWHSGLLAGSQLY